MASTADEIAIKLGINVGDFKAALADAGAAVKKLKSEGEGGLDGFSKSMQGAQKTLNTFKQVLAGAGIVGIVKGLTDAGVEFAQNWKGGFDDAVAATLRLKASQSDLGSIVKNTTGRIGVELVSAMEKFGIAVGSLIFGTEAASDALTKLDEESRKAFDEARLAKITAAEQKLAAVRAEAAGGVTKLNFLLGEQNRLTEERSKFEKGSAEFITKTAEIEAKRLELTKELTSQSQQAEANAKKAADERDKAEKDAADARRRGFEETAANYNKLAELLSKQRDSHLEQLTLSERQNQLLKDEAQLEGELADLEEGSAEFNEKFNELLDTRGKLRKTESDAIKTNIEIAKLLLIPEDKRTEVQKEHLKLLTGETTERQQAIELQNLLQRGVENLTEDEKNRVAVLSGATRELEKQTNEIAKQAAAQEELLRTRGVRQEGNVENLSAVQLNQLILNLNKQISFMQATQGILPRGFTPIEERLLKDNLAAAQRELDLRKDFERTLKAFGSVKTEATFAPDQFARLSQFFNPDQAKKDSINTAVIASGLQSLFPDKFSGAIR